MSTLHLMSKISFGFDIATAISIIGAVFAFIINLKEQNIKKIEGEQEAERVRKLMEVQGIVSSHVREFVEAWKLNSKAPLDIKEKVLFKTHTTIVDLYKRFMSIIPIEDLNSFNSLIHYDMTEFNEARYLIKLVELDMSMIYRIRQIMNQEKPNESYKVIDDYVEFVYKGYSELKNKIKEADTKDK